MKRCLYCFGEFADVFDVCPECGHSVGCLPVPEDALTPGTVLHGRYVIGKTAGRGGFGTVYRAFDTVLGEVVAVKELNNGKKTRKDAAGVSGRPEPSHPEAYYRLCKRNFLNEARIGAELRGCPGICAVREYFEEDSGAYIVMDYFSGMQLSDYIGMEECDLRFAVFVAEELCRILENVHNRNKVHRDVAPDNIIVCTDGEGIGIRLLDFGAARKNGEMTEKKDTVLKTGFSPPEQYFPGKASCRGDVYSVGATLYAMLCGACPGKLRENEKFLKLPDADKNKIFKKLGTVIATASDRNPAARFRDVKEMRHAIEKASEAIASCLPKSRVPLLVTPEVPVPPKKETEICDVSEKRGVSVPTPERLLPGTILAGRYSVGLDCKRQGDCIVYEASDRILRCPVSLTEYFPKRSSARDYDGVGVRQTGTDGEFRDGRALFYDAAQRLCRRKASPGEERYTDMFSENDTVYLVSDCTGMISLSDYLEAKKTKGIREKEMKKLLGPVGTALSALYASGFYHGNVSPDSIYTDGEKCVLRFSSMLCSPGLRLKAEKRQRFWSAPELSAQGSFHTLFSDIYSLAAVACYLMNGEIPPDSAERADAIIRGGYDPMKYQLSALSLSPKTGIALESALSFRPEERSGFEEVLCR